MSNIKKFIRSLYISILQIDPSKYKWKNLDKTKVLVPLKLFAHPIDGFNDVKFEKRGSLALANIILFIYFLEGIVKYFSVSYLFSNNEAQSFSIWPIVLKSIVIVVLWCTMNWAMCTLLDGEGKFKEIWIATCYALTPLVLFEVPLNIFSNFMTLSESMFYTAISNALVVWTLLLVFLGMMVVHQFTVTKTFGSIILTLIMMVIFAFLVLLAFSIGQQMITFVNTIATELLRR